MATNIKTAIQEELQKAIQQRTAEGFVNMSNLLEMVNEQRKLEGKEEKRMNDFFKTDTAQEYLHALLEDMGKLSNIEEKQHFSMTDLKAFEVYRDVRGKHKGAWFTPLLAIEIAGWMSPATRFSMYKMVGDMKIKTTIEAPDVSVIHEERKEKTVYFIQHEITKETKIGVTSNIKKRFNVLNSMNGNHLMIIAITKGNEVLERSFHEHFKKKRIKGTEWFKLSQKDIKLLMKDPNELLNF